MWKGKFRNEHVLTCTTAKTASESSYNTGHTQRRYSEKNYTTGGTERLRKRNEEDRERRRAQQLQELPVRITFSLTSAMQTKSRYQGGATDMSRQEPA